MIELPYMKSREWLKRQCENFSSLVTTDLYAGMPAYKLHRYILIRGILFNIETDINQWQRLDRCRRNQTTGIFLKGKAAVHRRYTNKLNKRINKLYNILLIDKLSI